MWTLESATWSLIPDSAESWRGQPTSGSQELASRGQLRRHLVMHCRLSAVAFFASIEAEKYVLVKGAVCTINCEPRSVLARIRLCHLLVAMRAYPGQSNPLASFSSCRFLKVNVQAAPPGYLTQMAMFQKTSAPRIALTMYRSRTKQTKMPRHLYIRIYNTVSWIHKAATLSRPRRITHFPKALARTCVIGSRSCSGSPSRLRQPSTFLPRWTRGLDPVRHPSIRRQICFLTNKPGIEVDDYPIGYPKLAAMEDLDPNFMITRRFGWLHMRLLLHLQDEITELEATLQAMDKLNADTDPLRLVSRRRDEGFDNKRKDLLQTIDEKLIQYGSVPFQ